ncbi:sister chromatid cohesion 1 protein 2-like isoform X1 [Pistacia vera]|uniref:sister chromatid cohesion 1 protein 2-like isoform X1 n=1 Tax=Pistacia vera TaxID=55513 RepID=UPI001262F27B|nr:sister chromatid cohesion 1 protein 2-like isoform X1 [Pistacia vera]
MLLLYQTGLNLMLLIWGFLKTLVETMCCLLKKSRLKYPFEDFPAWHDTFSTDYIPAEDIFASHLMETDMNVRISHDFSNLEASMEKLRGNIFTREEGVNLDTFCGTEGDASNPIEPFGEQVPEITQSENEVQGELGAEMLLDERLHDVGEEPLDHVKLYDEDHQSDGELTNLLGLARFEKETCLAVNEYNNLSNLQASMEKLLDHRLCQEASVDVEMFSTSKEPSELIKSSAEDHPSDGELTNLPHLAQLKKETCLAINKDNNLSNLQASTEKLLDHILCQAVSVDVEMFIRSKEPSESIKSSGGEHHTNAELMNSQEKSLPGNGKCQFMTSEDPVSITVDATPQSKFLDASGDSTPGFMVVHTPATKERARSKKKRKCCFDDVTVFPNHLIRQHIEDASDLVSKRRKVRTALTA